MPSSRSASAPRFEGKEVTSFLTSIVQHGANAGITDLNKLVSYILEYSTEDVKQLIRFMPEFDPEVSGKFLSQIAVPLIKKGKIPTTERDFYFVAGLPKDVKDWFLTQGPDAKRKHSALPSVPETIAILKKRFDEDSLAFQPWTQETKASSIQPLPSTTYPPAISGAGNSHVPTTSVDDIARQLERLTLALNAQSNNTGASNGGNQQSNAQPSQNQGGQMKARLRNCNETQDLLNANVIRYDLNTSRYVQADGSDLPRTPPGYPGGVADYMRALRSGNNQNANPPVARTSAIVLPEAVAARRRTLQIPSSVPLPPKTMPISVLISFDLAPISFHDDLVDLDAKIYTVTEPTMDIENFLPSLMLPTRPLLQKMVKEFDQA
ncbi:hypothetical protein K438DRAFT_1991352 [Mycena galopus ATCC 62051]|nr:hypothetical protein K438DRAFT_1991352 [Mycena galopus ATCC 62051]